MLTVLCDTLSHVETLGGPVMRLGFPLVILLVVVAFGCLDDTEPIEHGQITSDATVRSEDHTVTEDFVESTIPLDGFDPEGEPEIRINNDGSLHVVFNFMPPSWVDESEYVDLGSFADFDQEMQQAIGVPVVWEDREFFLIQAPEPDTVEKIRVFVEGYRHAER